MSSARLRPQQPQRQRVAGARADAARKAGARERRWRAAYELLPGARAARAKHVRDPLTFALEAFELKSSLQIGFRATERGTLEQLEGRFAPRHYLDHRFTAGAILITCEDAAGKRTRRIPPGKDRTGSLVGTVAELVGQVGLALVPLNDGDDLHFLFVTRDLHEQLAELLGSELVEALREQPAAPAAAARRVTAG